MPCAAIHTSDISCISGIQTWPTGGCCSPWRSTQLSAFLITATSLHEKTTSTCTEHPRQKVKAIHVLLIPFSVLTESFHVCLCVPISAGKVHTSLGNSDLHAAVYTMFTTVTDAAEERQGVGRCSDVWLFLLKFKAASVKVSSIHLTAEKNINIF